MRPEGAAAERKKQLACLRLELADRALQAKRAQDAASETEHQLLLSECLRDAELLMETLTKLANPAPPSEPPPVTRSRLLNCRRAIANALVWAGVYPPAR